MILIPKGKKQVVALIVGFLLLVFAYRCSADDAFLEAGPTVTKGAGIFYTERLTPRVDVGLLFADDQDLGDGVKVGNNGGVSLSFVFPKPATFWRVLPDELMLGPSLWITTSPQIGCALGYNLGLRYYLSDRWHVGWRHWSNAGSCKNHGLDIAVVGFRF